MTSKERAALRAEANGLDAMFQVGKEGVTEAVAAQMLDSLRTRELIKGKVLLESCPQTPRESADALAGLTGATVVQVVGGSMVFFKENPELRKVQAEKAKAAKARAKAAKATKARTAHAKPIRLKQTSRSTAAERKAAHKSRREAENG